uniref:Uncharacterized protein n=1 Tax=Anguilla anguilla TaxID=7936 RepID=A0A0E9Q2J4_ANGAN
MPDGHQCKRTNLLRSLQSAEKSRKRAYKLAK